MIPPFFTRLPLLIARCKTVPCLACFSMYINTSLSGSKEPRSTNINVSDLVRQPHGPYPTLSNPREIRLSSSLTTSSNEGLAAEISRHLGFVTRGLSGETDFNVTKPLVQASSQTSSPEPYCWNSGPPVRRQESVLAQTRHDGIASKGVVLGG